MVGGDDRDRLALVADLVPGQHRLVGDLEPVGLAAGHVLVREDGVHAADAERGRDVQLADPRARVRAAQRRAPQHPVGPQVGRVREVALDLRDAVGAADALADAAADRWSRRVMPPPPDSLAARHGGRARSSSSSPVSSRPSSTTVRPPTSSRSTRGRGPSTSAATGSAIPAWSSSSSRHSATSASLPGSSEPISASRPRQRAPWIVPSASASRAVSACGPPRQPRHEQRLAQLAAQLARLVGRRAVDAEPDRRAGGGERGHRRDAGAEPRVRGRAVRDAGAASRRTGAPRARRGARSGRARRRRRASRAARGTRPGARRTARGRTPPRRASRPCACAAARRACARSSAVSAISSLVTLNGEHGASAIRSIESGAGSW